MKKIRYAQLVEDLAKETNNTKKNVRTIMDAFIEKVKSLEHPGDKLYLRKLGKFEIIRMRERIMTLNNKKEKLPSRDVLKFKKS